MEKWAVALGIILIIVFLVTWGVGWIQGITGELGYNIIALVVGIILLIYGFVKK